MSSWWVVNIWELATYRDRMCEYLKSCGFQVREGSVATLAVLAYWRSKKKSPVPLPDFDRPELRGQIGSSLLATFDGDSAAAGSLEKMLREKAKTITKSNAPRGGLKTLLDLLSAVESYFKMKNEEIFYELFRQVKEADQYHSQFSQPVFRAITVDSLAQCYEKLADTFETLKGKLEQQQ